MDVRIHCNNAFNFLRKNNSEPKSNYFFIWVHMYIYTHTFFFSQAGTQKAYQPCTISEMYEQNMFLGLNVPPAPSPYVEP